MNKALLSLLAICSFGLSIPTSAQKIISYYHDQPFSVGYKFGNELQQGMAMYISPSVAHQLKGKQLLGLKTQLRTIAAREITAFISYDLNQTPIYKKTFKNTTTDPTTFTFDKAITLDGKPFYIGFTTQMPNAMCLPLGFDNSKPFSENIGYVLNDGQWDSHICKGLGAPNVQMVVKDDQPITDLVLKPFDISGVYKDQHKYTFQCEAFNLGTDTIKKVKIAVKVGDNDELEEIRKVAIAPNTNYDFQTPEYLISLGTKKKQQVTVKIIPVDQNDFNTANNVASNYLGILPATYNRKVLAEFFTSESCSNCPGAQATWKWKIVGKNQDLFVNVAHHNGYVPDRFSMIEGDKIAHFFDVQGTPAMMLNRKFLVGQKVIFHGGDIMQDDQAMKLVLEDESPLQVLVNTNYNPTTKHCQVKVKVQTFTTPSQGKHYLNVWLVQDSLKAFQVGTAEKENTIHNGLLRKSFTDVWGEEVQLEIGETVTKTYDFDLPEIIKSTAGTSQYGPDEFNVVPENMSIVAFVSDYDATNNEKCEVFNVAKEPILSKEPTSLTGIVTPSEANIGWKTIGNTLFIDGDFDLVKVFNANGQLVKKGDNSKPYVELQPGVYVVEFTFITGQKQSYKIVIP